MKLPGSRKETKINIIKDISGIIKHSRYNPYYFVLFFFSHEIWDNGIISELDLGNKF